MATVDLIKIQTYIDKGLVKSNKHPTLDLYVLNYTKKTQYENLWDDTTKMCRGLIIDREGNIVSNVWKKFYNLGQMPETMPENLPNEKPISLEKCDGSLGVLYRYGDEVFIATRGSFTSEAAIWATTWLQINGYTKNRFRDDFSYIFEIISPVSRIVVDYKGYTGLILLAVIDTKTGKETSNLQTQAEKLGFRYPKEYDFSNITEVKEYIETANIKGTDAEGFVCTYSNGLKVKFKFEDYRRLHKILTGLSTISIWEALKEDKFDSLIEMIPDEMYPWVRKQKDLLETQKKEIEENAKMFISENIKPEMSRKEKALKIITQPEKLLQDVSFNIIEGRPDKANITIWKHIRPKYEVYKDEGDDI